MGILSRYREKSRKKELSKDILSRLEFFSRKNSKGRSNNNISVDIYQDETSVYVTDGVHTFYFDLSEPIVGEVLGEVALWAFLPVAMAENKDLHIKVPCARESIENAMKLIEAWSCWLPGKYSLINVSTVEIREEISFGLKKSLLCFSGGVDSTYTLLTRKFPEAGVDFITVQGMDYYISDDDSFKNAKEKTASMASIYDSNRIYVRSNAYSIYKHYELAPRITYVFVLASCSFLYGRSYNEVVLASDFALYQQMEEVPYGASFATDHFFSSGSFSLISDSENVTRAEKLPVIVRNDNALKSLSFCKDRKVRPDNCGKCIKCVRTKYMFLASVGYIPEQCFVDASLDVTKKVFLSKVAKKQDAYIKSTYTAAFWAGNLDKIPMIVEAYEKLKR